MKTIPRRELRNRISRVLREVEAGQRMRITVDGRAVADLGPIAGVRRRFVPSDVVVELLRKAHLDRKFRRDLKVLEATIDEL